MFGGSLRCFGLFSHSAPRYPGDCMDPALHNGQVQLGSPMRALLCVGVAYFLIGVLVPVATAYHLKGGLLRVYDEGLGGGDIGWRAGGGRRCLHHLCV